MKKLILSIVAIFALQGAFIVYTAVNPFPEMAALVFPAPQVADDDMLFGNDLRAAVGGYQPAVVRRSEPSRPAPMRVERPETTVARAIQKTPRQRHEDIPSAESRVIFRNETASVVISPREESRESAVTDSPKGGDKRSFIANVVKKPYDLFKAIGSRLR